MYRRLLLLLRNLHKFYCVFDIIHCHLVFRMGCWIEKLRDWFRIGGKYSYELFLSYACCWSSFSLIKIFFFQQSCRLSILLRKISRMIRSKMKSSLRKHPSLCSDHKRYFIYSLTCIHFKNKKLFVIYLCRSYWFKLLDIGIDISQQFGYYTSNNFGFLHLVDWNLQLVSNEQKLNMKSNS